MMKVREFAESVGCTPQNVYLHLKNYAEELEGHVHKTRSGTVLDVYACNFIRDVMHPKEVLADAKLQEELAEARSMLFAIGVEKQELLERVTLLESEKKQLEDDAEKINRLLTESIEDSEMKEAELEEAQAKIEASEQRNQELSDELQRANDKCSALMNRGLWARITNKGV